MSEARQNNLPTQTIGSPLLLRQVKLRNYKSIGRCLVELRPLSVLVGRNGSGKSNFLDALRFVVDALQTSLDHAIKSRGGIDAVRRRSTGHPRNFGIELEMSLPDGCSGTYSFEIASRPKARFFVKYEELRIQSADPAQLGHYRIERGEDDERFAASRNDMPPRSPDRLYLVNAAGSPPFRAIYDALVSMGFYSLNPEAMKELQSPDAGELLHRDGRNIGSVIARLADDEPQVHKRILAFLQTIVPEIKDMRRVPLGPRETLEFRQEVVGARSPWTFYAASMSDGTLRALGALVAVTQLAARVRPVTLVGIEEPETALHPAAASSLVDALREAARRTQVVITTHSPDLLDQIDASTDALLAVHARQGTTEIGPVDRASLDAIRKQLYTPGELLRMDQLEPDREAIVAQNQMVLFDTGESEEEP